MMRIATVIPTLRAGGAERVLTRLTASFAARGFDTSIVCLMAWDEAPFFTLDRRVQLVPLDAIDGFGRIRWGSACWRMRRVLSVLDSDVVLAFTTVGGVLAATSLLGSSRPLVIAERADPRAHGSRIGPWRRRVRDWAHRRADRIVVQTARAKSALNQVPSERISVIGNPILPAAVRAAPAHCGASGRLQLVAAGRFVPDKGFDRLIDAFARIASSFPSWDLVIYGDGPLRPALTAQIAGHGLTARLRLPGMTDNLPQLLAEGHLLALPSRVEGFANVLGEAAAAGLPAVSYRDVGGVEALIVPGVTGLLADPGDAVPSLADALATLMANPDLRARMGVAAYKHAETFSVAAHDQAWVDLLATVVAERQREREHVRDHRGVAASVGSRLNARLR